MLTNKLRRADKNLKTCYDIPSQQNTANMGNRNMDDTGMLIGYARVSTDDQSLNLQIDDLTRHGVAENRIYEEYVSGTKTKRPVLEECLRALRPGDVLVVWRLDRLGRNLHELIDISKRLEYEKIGLRSLNENIDTTTAGGRLIFHIFGALAQFERDVISERTKAGLKAARLRGHRGGRKAKVDDKMLKAAEAMLADQTVTMRDAASVLGVSPAAIYRARDRKRKAEEAKALKLVK